MQEPPIRRGSVKVDGATLHYAIEGAGILILVIGSAIYYPRTFSHQLREACRLAFVDLRHFGDSDASFGLGGITVDRYADDIEHVRATLGFERVAVMGHSHHGNLALEYAKRYPARVSHVVLIGSPPCDVRRTIEGGNAYWTSHASGARKAALRDNWNALSSETLEAMSPDDALVAQYVADGPKYWYDPRYDASPLWQGVPVNMAIVTVFRGFFTDYELSWDPARLSAPVLVVMGRHDYVVPHVLWNEALPRLQNVTFHLFEQSGHTPQLEEQKLFDQILLEWIRKDSAAGAVSQCALRDGGPSSGSRAPPP